jgi:hypothetical protein
MSKRIYIVKFSEKLTETDFFRKKLIY